MCRANNIQMLDTRIRVYASLFMLAEHDHLHILADTGKEMDPIYSCHRFRSQVKAKNDRWLQSKYLRTFGASRI